MGACAGAKGNDSDNMPELGAKDILCLIQQCRSIESIREEVGVDMHD